MSAVRLAVVDDSTFVRKAIERMLRGDPRVEVVGTASSGEELLANLARWHPDVITLDLSMPGIGGLVTLDRIMTVQPTPVVILSTHAGRGAPQTIEALHRGAADFIDKQQYSLVDFHSLQEILVEKVLAVAATAGARAGGSSRAVGTSDTAAVEGAQIDVLLLGASTGGPPAIEQVLDDLGGDCPVPVLVVQHMPKGFTRAFADRLNAHLALEVHEAEDGVFLQAGTVYIGPAGLHLRLGRQGERLIVSLSTRPEAVSHRPSVDELFHSALPILGHRAAAVLLTGMGRDGAEGMASLARAGAYTLAQDEPSSVVWGMPGAAVAQGAARDVLPLGRIGPRLRELLVARRTAAV